MQLTFTIAAEEAIVQDDIFSIEVAPDATVDLLMDMIQADKRIPKTAQHIYHNGQLLADAAKTMEQLQIADGDMLALHVRETRRARPQPNQQAQQSQGQPGGGANDAETIRLQLLGNPAARQAAAQAQPELAAAIDDPARFAQLLQHMQEQERRERMQRQQHIAALNADPFDIDAQMRIAEMIREERVQENLQNAMEHNPEGQIFLLRIVEK